MQLVGAIVELSTAIGRYDGRTQTLDVILQNTDNLTPSIVKLFDDTTNIIDADIHITIVPELDVDIQFVINQTKSTLLEDLHDLIRLEVLDVLRGTKDTKDTENGLPDVVLLREEENCRALVRVFVLMALVVEFDHLHQVQ